MGAIGIVAEYNPFHTGHAGQIARTRAKLGRDIPVAAVMSGNWVQQADCAIADKWTRAQLALMGGVDLVLELPTVWAVSSAESFARGAVSILNASGIVDALSFGSESGDMEQLERVAACLDGREYPALLKERLSRGLSFPAARQGAAEQLLGPDAAALSRPNNTLGIEYIRALNSLNSAIRPFTVKREGAGHNEAAVFAGSASREETDRLFRQYNPTLSATAIRGHLMDREWELMAPYLPREGLALLRENGVELPALRQLERAMLTRVRTMSAEDWGRLPDAGAAEGLPNRLERAGRECRSMEEFFDLTKTKRYTHSRLRRLVLWAFLGITAADVPAVPPYIRVLGFNARGQELLREMKGRACLPILTMPVQARGLEEEGRRLFELESRCTDLYNLCRTTPRPAGEEWTRGPVRE
ncbi:MAG: nucleotidyltransferase family protein [Clostridiales bacterium]|nr:nucleotidyltransferase family protein [Clostridiales bacterium]